MSASADDAGRREQPVALDRVRGRLAGPERDEPDAAAHAIPPAAFQNRNFHQCIRPRPATQAAVKRRMAMKRPKKTVFAPWRAMMRSARGSTRSA